MILKYISVMALFFCFVFCHYAQADTDDMLLEPEPYYPEWMAPSAYSYNPEGMADPFVPFILARIQEQEAVLERAEPQRPLTPLEQVEVSQLKLVGVIWRSGQPPSAMVELPDGKGFILREGTVVGRNRGEVVEILPQEVVVLEKVTNIFGAIQDRRTSLKLRPGQVD